VLTRIVEAIQPSAADFIVEIGPGEGVLTKHLLQPWK
jgi:16S rRNA A1518/A1519 N6-dimethyltransferase RsmA/KsgA/DIM1 with predicted DNA glycosylase/AP lyase activity